MIFFYCIGVGDWKQEVYKHGEVVGVPISPSKIDEILEIFRKHFSKVNALEFAGVQQG